jgi:hypothetical protein
MNPREQIDGAMSELSALPSFQVFMSWLDEQRERSVATLSAPMETIEIMRWESGRVSLIDEIRQLALDNGIASDSYELTGRSVPARRQGKKEEGS